MSERDRLNRRIRDLESIEQGINANISDYQQRIIKAQRDRAAAGKYTDVLDRQRSADRTIKDLEKSIQGAKTEISRVRNEIKGIRHELNSLR
jgi:prefoldin subunit 5